MDVTKIKDRSLGEFLDDFYVCENCRIVDNDHGRLDVGYKCTSCGEPSHRGMSYFSTQVSSLITMMQEFYHTQQVITDDEGEPRNPWWAGNVKLPVIIFFTTLRELLLNNLIDELFKAIQIDPDICERLLADSPTHKQRLDKLFETLTGKKWYAALRLIDQNEGTDFISLDAFIVNVVNARNDFLHNGNVWEIKDGMAQDCIRNIHPMLRLHAYLHNYFVLPIYEFNRGAGIS